MTPEEKHAVRFIKGNKLSPPIDVEAAARLVADVEFVAFPPYTSADGITLDPKSARPRILVNSEKPRTRQIFTLAHEIGHVVIPWHTGNIVSHLDDIDLPYTSYWLCEREANHFAAELLMPTEWVNLLLATHSNGIRKIYKELLSQAEVSPIAATYRLSAILPINYAWAVSDEFGMVAETGRTHNSTINLCSSDGSVRVDDAYRFASSRETFESGGKQYCWWYFGDQDMPEVAHTATWRDVLRKILEDVEHDPSERKRLSTRISAVSGFILGKREYNSVREEYARVLSRFEGRSELRAVVRHRDFKTYVRLRVEEFLSK